VAVAIDGFSLIDKIRKQIARIRMRRCRGAGRAGALFGFDEQPVSQIDP
jgi:hypothetical protein